MNPPEILPYLGSIAVMKATTGSVSVSTPNGPVVLSTPGFRYQLAGSPEEVEALLKMSNIRELLRKKLVNLVL